MHLIALCCCVFHVLHVYLKNLKMNMTNYFLTFRFCVFQLNIERMNDTWTYTDSE